MPDFAEYFGDDARHRRVVIPGLAEYYKTPSRDNARALLVSLRLHVPYATLAAASAASTAAAATLSRRPAANDGDGDGSDDVLTIASDTSSSGGAGRRHRRRASIPPAAFFAAHRLIDLLHDLLDIPPPMTVLERLYRTAASVPKQTTDALTRLVGDVWASTAAIPSVNRRLVELAEGLAGLSPTHRQTLAFKPDHTAVAIQMDTYLQAAVARWLAKPSLEIVLDGVFRDVQLPPADAIGRATALNTAVNDAEIARSLTLCAYLQLVLTDWPSPPSSIRAKDVRFLIGDFQTLDIPGANQFIAAWIRHIRTETAYLSHLPPDAVGTRPIALADLPSLADTPFANVTMNASGLRVKLPDRPNATGAMLRAIRKGIFVPYGRKRTTAHRRPPIDRMPPSVDAYRSEFFTANKKEWLRAVFRAYGYDAAPTAETDVFIETLSVVNAFRDALRAEVALARDAVYITPDALALVYYQARAGRGGRGLRIHPAGPEDLAIRYYAAFAAPSVSSLHSAISRR